jgi:hypothetical protein
MINAVFTLFSQVISGFNAVVEDLETPEDADDEANPNPVAL